MVTYQLRDEKMELTMPFWLRDLLSFSWTPATDILKSLGFCLKEGICEYWGSQAVEQDGHCPLDSFSNPYVQTRPQYTSTST